MARFMAFVVATQITWKQQGIRPALRGHAPDLHALDRVPGVSHIDLYNTHRDNVGDRLTEAEVEGRMTLQDLVEVKEWIAAMEGVEVIESSRIETALLFIRSGGDAETGTVATADVLTLLDGAAPAVRGDVTIASLRRAQKTARWTR